MSDYKIHALTGIIRTLRIKDESCAMKVALYATEQIVMSELLVQVKMAPFCK